MIVPNRNPSKVLMRSCKVNVGAILSEARTVVAQRHDFAFGEMGTLVDADFALLVLVDVVAEMELGCTF